MRIFLVVEQARVSSNFTVRLPGSVCLMRIIKKLSWDGGREGMMLNIIS